MIPTIKELYVVFICEHKTQIMNFVYKSCLNLLFFFALLSLSSMQSHAQSVGVTSGIGVMSLFDFHENTDYNYANYRSGGHQFVKLDFSNIFSGTTFPILYINLQRSSGYINTSRNHGLICGLGDYSSLYPYLNTDFTLYRMGFGILPLSAKIYKGIQLTAGLEFSRVLRSEYTDHRDNSIFNRGRIFNQSQNTDNFLNKMGIGLTIELQFGKFSFGNNLILQPVYNVGMSLLDEFDTDYSTRTIRQSLGLAFRWHSDSLFK